MLSYLIAIANTQKRQRNLNQMTTKFFKIRMCRELSTQNVNFMHRIIQSIRLNYLSKLIILFTFWGKQSIYAVGMSFL